MRVNIEISNYRCFEDSSPARLSVAPGIISILGSNNAGKSALLRFFYEFRPLLNNLGQLQPWQSFQSGGKLGGNIQAQDPRGLFSRDNRRDLSIKLQLVASENEHADCFDGAVIGLERDGHNFSLKQLFRRGEPSQMVMAPQPRQMDALCKAFQLLADSMYIPVFRTPISGSDNHLFDMPLGRRFVQAWAEAAVGTEVAKREACQEIQRQAAELLGVSACRLHLNSEQSGFLVEMDNHILPIDEVGGGISQILMVLATIATRKPQLLLCDEPEASLHPTLQIAFASALAKHAKHSVMFATHSLGLARSVSDAIYIISRDGPRSVLRPFGAETDASDVLAALQYSTARELGYDTVLLVEGSTEVMLFHQWLRWFGLDRHVFVSSMGGSNMVSKKSAHALQEIQRLSSRVFVIIDSEKNAKSDKLSEERAEFEKLCRTFKYNIRVLENGRAIENYFPVAAIQHVKGPKYRALQPYERLKDCEPSWAKSENWRIAAAMDPNELHPELKNLFTDIQTARRGA